MYLTEQTPKKFHNCRDNCSQLQRWGNVSQGSVCCEISTAKFPVPQRSKQSPGHLGGTLLAAATHTCPAPPWTRWAASESHLAFLGLALSPGRWGRMGIRDSAVMSEGRGPRGRCGGSVVLTLSLSSSHLCTPGGAGRSGHAQPGAQTPPTPSKCCCAAEE